MSLPNQEDIFKRFPRLFSQKDLSIQESCMAWGLSHGEGWNPIIVELCEAIEAHYKELAEKGMKIIPIGEDAPEELEEGQYTYEVEFAQVKSKWYRLTVYYIGGDETVSALVSEAEEKSTLCCEGCAVPFPTKQEEGGGRHSYCEECRTRKRDD